MMSSSTPSRVPWHAVIVALVTALLLWWFLRSIDLGEAWRATLDAHWGWIAAAVAVTIQTYVIRAWRWQVLLAPIGTASFRAAFRTTVMGFAANLLLPARAGEFLRPYLLSRSEGLNAASAFATIVVERLLDLVTVLLLFACVVVFSGVNVSPAVEDAGLVAAGIALGGLAVLFVLAGHPERLARWADRLALRLPTVLARLVSQLVRTLAEGLKVMRSPSHLAWAIVWSLPLWLSIALGIIFTSWAFGLQLSFMGSFLVLGYLTVGVMTPTPGAAGGFHLAYKLALTQLMPDPGLIPTIVAAAIVLHLVSFGPVTLLGLLFMWQDGLTLGGVTAARRSAEAPDGTSNSVTIR